MKIDNTKSPTPAPTALRLTREADAAVDAVGAILGGKWSRHRVMVASLTYGARALAADPSALLRLLVGDDLVAAAASSSAIDDRAAPPLREAPTVEKPGARPGVAELVAAVKKAGGEMEVTARDAAKIVGRSSHSAGQLLGHEYEGATGALRVERLPSRSVEGSRFSTRYRLTVDGKPIAAQASPPAPSPRRVRDEAYDAYLASVAAVVAKKPGHSVEWSCGDMARNVPGRPATNSRGLANALATMARNNTERCGLRVIAMGEERDSLAVFRLIATVPA